MLFFLSLTQMFNNIIWVCSTSKSDLSGTMQCDQIHCNHCYDFSPNFQCYLRLTWMFNKPVSNLKGQLVEIPSETQEAQLIVIEYVLLIAINLVTLNATTQLKLLFNKPASGTCPRVVSCGICDIFSLYNITGQ